MSKLSKRVDELERKTSKLPKSSFASNRLRAAGVKNKHAREFYEDCVKGMSFDVPIEVIALQYQLWKAERNA